MQESKSRSSDARSVTDNEEEDTAEQRREDGDGCRDVKLKNGEVNILRTMLLSFIKADEGGYPK